MDGALGVGAKGFSDIAVSTLDAKARGRLCQSLKPAKDGSIVAGIALSTMRPVPGYDRGDGIVLNPPGPIDVELGLLISSQGSGSRVVPSSYKVE